MWPTYEACCNFFWSKNMEPLSEEIYNRDYAPKKDKPEEVEPMILTPNNKSRPMSATLENHIAAVGKTIKPKKKYAPRISRKGWTTEQIKARRSENSQNCKARKKSNQVIL